MDFLSSTHGLLTVSSCLLPFVAFLAFPRRSRRTSKLSYNKERVVILGSSSGIGRSIAVQYARRGAKVFVFGRRQSQVDEVIKECKAASPRDDGAEGIRGSAGDFANVDDMVRIRVAVQSEWGGIDTLVVAAGVSALKPLMNVAGVENPKPGQFQPSHASAESIQEAADIANLASHSNYIGPLVAVLTFVSTIHKIPASFLQPWSFPAAVIPAPTRTIYASTKAASLVLYQALSIEHPDITFTSVLPSTVEGDFRASAVDAGPVREANPNKHGLKREDVAARCILAVDRQEKAVFMPWTMKIGMLLYWICPSFIEWRARVKYNFNVVS
ncbi:hypothetical protein HGRIS_007395 [Hohenbuehelia grisea]|uniref:NAD(P)-binding protein n=1 Tax=Hohenbuehelia grisea TaxID=104357 RepID=A0ABR3J510_9AGAR